MTSSDERLFSREQLLGGLPARRAAATLFAIENRTARLVVRSRRACELYVSERAAAREEAAFLAALAEGRDPPMRPSIEDIERQAPAWADLLPDDPSLRAAVAHQLGAKYRLRRSDAARIRGALGIDEVPVAAAYARLYGQPIEEIFRDRLGSRERLGWLRSRVAGRLEDLPPAWSAFALTLTETVGAGVLALPIALAGLGILPALALLVGFGLVNVLTIAALVESINRDGAIRYGSAYFGRLVEDYLGLPGRAVLSVAMVVVNVLSLLAYVTGLGSTLATFTGAPLLVWVALLGLVTLVILARGSLNATVATAMAIGFTNIALLLALALLGLGHLDVARITVVPAVGAGSVALVFGVVLGAYFGHTSAGTAAKLVLARDPTGRSLMRGNVAAMLVAIGLYSLVVVGVNGAVPAARLAGFGGTAIEPLAGVVGPGVAVLGGAFVILALGLASVIVSLALYSQALEVLAERSLAGRRRPALARLLAGAPVIAAFGVVPILVALGLGTFSGPIAALGALATPVVGGVFPMLMVLAARRRGEYGAGRGLRPLAHPVTVTAIGGMFTAGVLVQGWLIAGDLLSRAASVGVALVIGALVANAIRTRAFSPRAVLEIRADGRSNRLRFGFLNAGVPAPVSVSARGPLGAVDLVAAEGSLAAVGELAAATFSLPPVRELAVWAHRVTDDEDSVPLDLAIGWQPAANAPSDAEPDAASTRAPRSGHLTVFPGDRWSEIRVSTERKPEPTIRTPGTAAIAGSQTIAEVLA